MMRYGGPGQEQRQREVAQVGGKDSELATNVDKVKDMGIVDEG